MHTYTLSPSNHADTSTSAFIEQLAAQMPQRRKYMPPVVYLALWLAASLIYILFVATSILDVRFDLHIRLKDPVFLAMVAFMFAGAIAFAYSSLISSLPAHKDRFGYFGLGATLTWVSLLVYGMVCDIPALLSGQMFFHFDLRLFGVLLIAGGPALLALWCISRHLAPLQTNKVVITISLASFMLAATVLRFFYVSLYNGVDCSFNLFFWMALPLLASSSFSATAVRPFMRSWLPQLRIK